MFVPLAVLRFVKVNVCPVATLITPADEASVTFIRNLDKDDVILSVPIVEPLPKVIAPAARLLPRLAVADADTVPSLITVPPVYVFVFDNVRDPEPDLVKAFTEDVDVEFAASPFGKTPLIVKLPLLPPIGIVSVFLTKSEAAVEFVFQKMSLCCTPLKSSLEKIEYSVIAPELFNNTSFKFDVVVPSVMVIFILLGAVSKHVKTKFL